MTRRVVAAMAIWALLVGAIWLLFGGEQMPGCLGPLGVTPAQCRAALGLPPETWWDGAAADALVAAIAIGAGWVAIWVGARLLGRRRQRGGL